MLISALGTVWSWWRLSVIGSLSYETMISGSVATALGFGSTAEMLSNATGQQFGVIMILMSIGMLSGFLILIPFGKKLSILGKGISSLSEQFGYGSNFYKMVSEDLQTILPDVKSFSPTNLKYMRYFYEMYSDVAICPQTEDDLIDNENRPQAGDNLRIIFRIPWGHNKIIIDKCKGNTDKALFYIRKTIENNGSRDVLLNFLGTDLYERQGKAITNFSNTLPAEQSDLAQAITKDPYNFDFLTLREKYDEKELKDALIQKVNTFLMELGTGFAYMCREVRIEVGDTEKFIDMLFYNTQKDGIM